MLALIGVPKKEVERCYKCRIGHVVQKACASCGAVQDFMLYCPHPACKDEPGVCTSEFDMTPESLLKHHYFCSAEHANATYEVSNRVYIYKDSESHESYRITQKQIVSMHTTVAMYVKQVIGLIGAFREIDAANFLLCIDEHRTPGNQMNFASEHELFLRYHDAAATLMFIPRSEYAAQIASFGVVKEEVDDTFWPTKGTHAQVVNWLKSRGLVGATLTEAGTHGPRMTKQAPFAVVTTVSAVELRKLIDDGFPAVFMVCPYTLRKVNYVVVLHCENSRVRQEAVYDDLSAVWKNSDAYVDRIMTTFRQFGIGPYGAAAIDINRPMEIERYEAEVEVRVKKVKKRQRTRTTADTIKDLRALGFKVEHQKGIIRLVKDSKPRVRPFAVVGPNSYGIYYVVVPLTIAQSETFLPMMTDTKYMTQTCFLEYRLVLVSCGDSVNAQQRTCAHLEVHFRDQEFLQRLLESMRVEEDDDPFPPHLMVEVPSLAETLNTFAMYEDDDDAL